MRNLEIPANLPMQTRIAPLAANAINIEARTVNVVFTTGAAVRRRRWTGWDSAVPFDEILRVSPEAINLDRLNAGAPALDSHRQYDTSAQIGVVERAWIDGSEGRATVRFPKAGLDAAADRMFGLVSDGIIRNISVGYVIDEARVVEAEKKGQIEQRIVERWTPMEISFVTIPADAGAQVRAGEGLANPESDEGHDNPAPIADAGQRGADIRDIGTRAHMDAAVIEAAIRDGVSVDDFRALAFADMAQRTPRTSSIRVDRDETETRAAAMQEALTIGLTPPDSTPAEPSEAARAFMGLSIVDLAAERLGERRVPGSFGEREELLRRAFHNMSDFPILFEGALNSSLASRYRLAQPTYRRIARQRTYDDFRDHATIRVGDFPDLQDVSLQGGEIKAGTFSESKEKTAVKAYGVRVDFSRQLLVNDSLDGISRVLADRGNAVARFEDRTFYAMMLSGANADGPTLLETARQMFNAIDGTKAAVASPIDVTSLSMGRAALRKRKTKDGAELDLTPAILLCGPDRETQAQQIVAKVKAAQPSNVNPLSGMLSVEVTAKITDYAWYLFASPEEAACFEWGLLAGYTAPRFRTEDPFGQQGVSMSLEHDFGCGPIDFRGGYKNAGA